MITVIGAGRDKLDMTIKGANAINSADKVVIKTTLTDTYKYFLENDIEVISLDNCYEEANSFDELDEKIVNKLLELSKSCNVAYVVNGVGYDDTSVIKLQKETQVNVIAGVNDSANILEQFPFTDYTLLSGHYFVDKNVINIDKRIPLIVKEIDNKPLASTIKLWLSKLYGDEQTILFFNGKEKKELAIYELDRQDRYDYNTMLLIKPLTLTERKAFDFSDLLEIMYTLRSENGCKWDKAQTHESIRKNLIEEAYELAEAIDNEDIDNMIEETGDVLLQSVFHSVIGEQTGEYDMYEVLFALCDKLISRHTHIFGDDKVTNPEDALAVWEKNKDIEKKHDTFSSSVNDVPKCLPALIRAQKVCKRTKKAGWGFNNLEEMLDKLKEEVGELIDAFSVNNKDLVKEEVGDTFMVLADFCRLAEVDGEEALYSSTEKVVKRFNIYEELVLKDNKNLLTLTDKEKDDYYKKAKELSLD